ncbi:hypothetical protein [Ekhidna sp.]|uniref:hypothetical protein n=1 Tax=Ekhidna sp. TaxID=2608089 RepID=UPI003C79CE51
MFFRYLFIRSSKLFETLDESGYILIRWFVIVLVALNFSIYNGIVQGGWAFAVIGGVFIIGLLYLLLVHIVPFVLNKISKWSDGISDKKDLSHVLSVSLIPLLPALLFETYSEISGNFIRSSEFLNFIMKCVSLKILILGLAKTNKYSTKNAAITLLTFWVFVLILSLAFSSK